MRNVSGIFRNFVILYKIQQGLLLSFMFYSNVHNSTSVLSSLPLSAGAASPAHQSHLFSLPHKINVLPHKELRPTSLQYYLMSTLHLHIYCLHIYPSFIYTKLCSSSVLTSHQPFEIFFF